MSAYNEFITVDSHYVPRMHIYYFTESRTFDKDHNPKTPVTIKRRGKEPFKKKNLDGICSEPNFYDTEITKDKDSIEGILADYELYFNKKLEKLREGINDGVGTDVVASYVANLEARSIIYREMAIDAVKELGSKSNPKNIQILSLIKGLDYLGDYPIEEYTGVFIIAEGDHEFITSDVPVIRLNNCEVIREIGIDIDFSKMVGYERETVYICPLSSLCCAIIFHKGSKNCDSFVKLGDIYTLDNINRLMCNQAREYLFYAHHISEECIRLFESNKYSKKSNLIIGAGFSSATVARLLADRGEKVTVIERKGHIAGNCFDYRDDNNIMIHKYGSHIFHTSNRKVWDFLRKYTDFNLYMHKVKGIIDGIEAPIPFNLNTLHLVFPKSMADRLEKKLIDTYGYGKKVPILEFQKQDDEDLKYLAQYVYEKIFLHYTMKQWGHSPDEVDVAVTARVPVYISRNDRYFQDTYQGIPLEGYTETVRKILDHPNIEVRLNTEFKKEYLDQYDRVFYTGPIDEFMDYKYGPLPYRSLRFELKTYDQEHVLSNAVINYPSADYEYTRQHEYKYYLNDKSDKTVVATEYPEPFELGKNERYYPIPKEENIQLYNKYLDDAKQYKNLYFLGRLGDYKYYDMDKAILRAMELVESLKD